MKRTTALRQLQVSATGAGLVSRGGLALLADTARVASVERELRRRLGPWRRPRAMHDPARVVLQLAMALAAGGDCLADIGVLRDATAIVGPVPSDPTVSRVIDDPAAGGQPVLDAIAGAHAAARGRVHARGGGPRSDRLVPLDVDPTIVVAHSEKELGGPTFKRTFGHRPVLAFLDHGAGGTGEALAGLLRRGSANANTAADLITTLDAALGSLPEPLLDGGCHAGAFDEGVRLKAGRIEARGRVHRLRPDQRLHDRASGRDRSSRATAVSESESGTGCAKSTGTVTKSQNAPSTGGVAKNVICGHRFS